MLTSLANNLALDQDLPPLAQKVLDPASPLPLRQMAAKGLAPGLRPVDTVRVVILIAQGSSDLQDTAAATLRNLPAAVLNGALAGDLHPLALHALAPQYAERPDVAEKILTHPAVTLETVVELAKAGSEATCELIATNEERLLAHPSIIEWLYRNKRMRMSTADRIIELAVRNGITLEGIAAFREIAAAISGELISEPSDEPTPDDLLFRMVDDIAEAIGGAAEDTHELSEDTGKEQIKKKFEEQEVRWQDLTNSAKIRRACVGKASERMLAIRDSNPLVRAAAAKSEALTQDEASLICGNANMAEDVLRILGNDRMLMQKHPMMVKLVMNPRTPLAISSKFITRLRESELKQLAQSRSVKQDLSLLAKQQLQRKGK